MAAVEKRRGRIAGVMLTKKLGERICAHVATGTPKLYAAQAEGVSKATVLEWVRRGEGRDDRPATPLMVEFAKAMRRAEAQDVNRRKVRLDAIAESGDPRVDMWWLERRHPEEFGRPTERVELTGAGGGPIEVRLAFDATPIPARPRGELGGPIIDVEAIEET